jgi:hypothetical protein
MKIAKRILSLLLPALLAFASAALAADPAEEDTTPRNKKIYLEPEKTLLERGKIKLLGALTFGYDDNAHLNSNRDHDVYTQQFVSAKFITPLDKKTQGMLTYDLMNLMYADSTDLNLIRNTFTAGLDHACGKDFIVSPVFTLDSVTYYDNNEDDWVEPAAGVRIKQRLPNKMYQAYGYGLAWRSYYDQNIFVTATTQSDKKRYDWRNTFDYEIGRYFEKDWVKLFAQLYNNNSNEKYLNYWDYNSYRFGSSLTHLFNDKLSGFLSGYWQYRKYRTRTLVLDPTKREKDSTYVLTAAGYYDITKSFTVGLNYTYRQNESNEPTEEYSGSLVALSGYYRF